MRNVTMTRKNGKLIVEIDLKQAGSPSSTGKTTVIATTSGNAPVPDMPGAFIGINVYTKP